MEPNIKLYINSTDYRVEGSFLVAADEWNAVLVRIGANIRIEKLYSYQSNQANCSVTVVPFLGQAAVETQLSPSNTSIYTKGAILVNNNKYINYFGSTQQINVAIHEIGHLLGLKHTTGGYTSIMNADISDVNVRMSPTSYDESQLRRLY